MLPYPQKQIIVKIPLKTVISEGPLHGQRKQLIFGFFIHSRVLGQTSTSLTFNFLDKICILLLTTYNDGLEYFVHNYTFRPSFLKKKSDHHQQRGSLVGPPQLCSSKLVIFTPSWGHTVRTHGSSCDHLASSSTLAILQLQVLALSSTSQLAVFSGLLALVD